MKNYWIIAFMVFWSIRGSTQTYPDSEGYYMYYVNLNIAEVPNNFGKEDFLALLEKNRELLDAEIVRVEKSFPTAVTDFLQHSISIYAKSQELEHLMVSKEFNLVEFAGSEKMILLFQPNDYGNITHPVRNNNNAHLELINAKEAWEITQGDKRVLIGITDTYIETTHDDLKNKIAGVWTNASPDYHGVSVSGCAAGETNNGLFLPSIGNKTEIVFSSFWGNHNEVLLLAQNSNIRVINLSWGNTSYTTTNNSLYNSILNNHNTVVVGGAGNEPYPPHYIPNADFYPASYPAVISVTSVGHRNDYGYNHPTLGKWNWADCHEQQIGDGTNGVSTHHHNSKVNICAPGYAVKAITLNNTTTDVWGTSFASPIVAGVCALVVAVNPCLTAVEVKDIVLSTADPTIYQIPENQPYIGLLGSGRVDAYAAVLKALNEGTEHIQNKTYNTTNAITEFAETAMYAGYNVTNTQPLGLVTVNPNANVTFEATHSIILSEGFTVQNNASFEAKIVDSPCW
jgi:subtilisin family serine protease